MITLTRKVLAALETLTDEQAGVFVRSLQSKDPTGNQVVDIIKSIMADELEKKERISKIRSEAARSRYEKPEISHNDTEISHNDTEILTAAKEKKPPLQERISIFSKESQDILGAKGVPQVEINDFIRYWTSHKKGAIKFEAEKATTRSVNGTFDHYKRYLTFKRILGNRKVIDNAPKFAGRQSEYEVLKNINKLSSIFSS